MLKITGFCGIFGLKILKNCVILAENGYFAPENSKINNF